MKTRTIGYAYPTSPLAKQLSCYRTGGHYAAERRENSTNDRGHIGPFNTAEEAARAAVEHWPDHPWDRHVERYRADVIANVS